MGASMHTSQPTTGRTSLDISSPIVSPPPNPVVGFTGTVGSSPLSTGITFGWVCTLSSFVPQ